MRRLGSLERLFYEWQQLYSRRAEDAQGDWLRAQLLRRAHLCDQVAHELSKCEDLIWDVVQTPTSPH